MHCKEVAYATKQPEHPTQHTSIARPDFILYSHANRQVVSGRGEWIVIFASDPPLITIAKIILIVIGPARFQKLVPNRCGLFHPLLCNSTTLEIQWTNNKKERRHREILKKLWEKGIACTQESVKYREREWLPEIERTENVADDVEPWCFQHGLRTMLHFLLQHGIG